jgi:hypothetical protein
LDIMCSLELRGLIAATRAHEANLGPVGLRSPAGLRTRRASEVLSDIATGRYTFGIGPDSGRRLPISC